MGNTRNAARSSPSQTGSSPRVWGIRSDAGRNCGHRAVHPHVCGEYDKSWNICTQAHGSSPRVWGIRSVRGVVRYPFSVHPHVCGEYITLRIRHTTIFRFIPTCVGNTQIEVRKLERSIGSSPRVWGILYRYSGGAWSWRFIPTCVGNTCGHTLLLAVKTVHPHVCGEYSTLTNHRQAVRGSSPRVWGIPFHHILQHRAIRFIPTCVGNTKLPRGSNSPRRGSSPRVWGIRNFPADQCRVSRFIPTCVGNTPERRGENIVLPVHPHVCGEYVRQGQRLDPVPRFIPTCVGNTNLFLPSLQNLPVHPHVCGEYICYLLEGLL